MSALASVRTASITGLTAQPRHLCQLFCCFIINKGRERLRVWLRVVISRMLTISGILYFFFSPLQGVEREGVLEHRGGSTVLWTSSNPWNPSQQYEFGSAGCFSKSRASTEFGRNKMRSAENFWSILPFRPRCLSPASVKCQITARCSWSRRLAYGIWECHGEEHNFASSRSLEEF